MVADVPLLVGLAAERRMNLVLGAGEPGAVGDGHLGAALEWIEFFGSRKPSAR